MDMTHKMKAGYKVGKYRPPVGTRWRPGQSGNPKGRPKGAKNIATILNNALNQMLEIQEKGKPRNITVREAILIRVVNQALKGDIKAIAFVLAHQPEIEQDIAPQKITSSMSIEELTRLYRKRITQVKG